MSETQVVALIGTGIMGAGMGKQLVGAGLPLRVWNRTETKARPLVDAGAEWRSSPAAAAEGADLVITMVTDGPAVESVATGDDGLLAGLGGSGTWLQMSTVSIGEQEGFAETAREKGIDFVDAPVLGTKGPAEQGTLIVLAGCDDRLRDRLEPVFDAVGSRTIWAGRAGMATRLKLVCNTWVLGLLGVLGETVGLAEGLELDPRRFLEAISGGPLDSGYARIKGDMMLGRDYPAAFPLEHALKDTRLIRDAAARAGVEPRVMRAVADAFAAVLDEHGKSDMGAVVEAYRPGR